MLALDREILHRLLTHFHPRNYEAFFNFFEEKERIPLSKIKEVDAPLELRLDDQKAIFHQIHYSWYLPILEKLPQEILENCLPLFSPEQLKGFKKFKFSIPKVKKSSSFLDLFYQSYFLKEIGYDQIPPKCFLPNSSNNRLLHFSKRKLVEIIKHLGVFEIANISKRVVDKKVISQLEKRLSTSQKQVFEYAKRTEEPKSASVKDLKKMLIDEKTFCTFLESRGIARFARGIVMDHSYLIWRIAHILDRGRGQELLVKARRFMPNPYTPFYSKQVLEVCEILEAKKEA